MNGHDAVYDLLCKARMPLTAPVIQSEMSTRIIQAYLSASNQVLVPRNADIRMMQVGVNRYRTPNIKDISLNAMVGRIYADMVDAAPNPFKDK